MNYTTKVIEYFSSLKTPNKFLRDISEINPYESQEVSKAVGKFSLESPKNFYHTYSPVVRFSFVKDIKLSIARSNL